MTAATDARPDTAPTSTYDELDHYYCCDPNMSRCGMDLSLVPEVDEMVRVCVVCDELDLLLHECPCSCGCCPAGRGDTGTGAA